MWPEFIETMSQSTIQILLSSVSEMFFVLNFNSGKASRRVIVIWVNLVVWWSRVRKPYFNAKAQRCGLAGRTPQAQHTTRAVSLLSFAACFPTTHNCNYTPSKASPVKWDTSERCVRAADRPIGLPSSTLLRETTPLTLTPHPQWPGVQPNSRL